jgi:hypothetical protein
MKRIITALMISVMAIAGDFSAGIAVGVERMDYLETVDNEPYSSEKGDLAYTKFTLGYDAPLRSWIGNGKTRFEVSYKLSDTNTDYTGAYFGQPFGSLKTQTSNSFQEFELRVKGLDRGEDYISGIYLSTSYYQWDRELSATQIEVYKYYTIGVGGEYLKSLGDISIGVDGMLWIALDEQMDLELKSYNYKTTLELGDTYGYEIGIPVVYEFSESFQLNARAAYKFRQIGVGTVNEAGFYEPESTTDYALVELGARFSF